MNAEAAAPAPYVTPAIQTLYRVYRPTTFDAGEFVGQEHIIRTLRSAIRQGRLAHAYLFTGPRGTGKTSTARLLAKAANCLHPDPDRRPCNRCNACLAIVEGRALDLIEIDAASNRGIDEIRDLRDKVNIPPAQLTYRFYIIDECHQLTTAAWNAFLKTLEEPPPHAKFVLCTTEPEKLLDTVASRCQRFDFRRYGVPETAAHLRTICEREGLAATDEALTAIGRQATGSMRDAITLLDTLASYGTGGDGITLDTVRDVLGAGSDERVLDIVDAIAANDIGAGIAAVNAAAEAGVEPGVLAGQVVAALRGLLYAAYAVPGQAAMTDAALAARLPQFAPADLAHLTKLFSQTEFRLKHTAYGHLPLELAVVDAVLLRTGQAHSPTVAATLPAMPAIAPTPAAPLSTTPLSASPPAMPPPTSVAPTATILVAPVAAIPAARPASTSRPTRPAAAALALPVSVAPDDGPALRPDQLRRDRNAPPAVASVAPSVAPLPPAPADAEPVAAPDDGQAAHLLEQLNDRWGHIKQMVKMEGKSKAYAMLLDTTPQEVRGDVVVLTTIGPHHCKYLNEDDVRALLEKVIGEAMEQPLRVICELHSPRSPGDDEGSGTNGNTPRPSRSPRGGGASTPVASAPIVSAAPPVAVSAIERAPRLISSLPPSPSPSLSLSATATRNAAPTPEPVAFPTPAPQPPAPQSLAVPAASEAVQVQLQRMSNLFDAQILDPRDAPPFPDEDS